MSQCLHDVKYTLIPAPPREAKPYRQPKWHRAVARLSVFFSIVLMIQGALFVLGWASGRFGLPLWTGALNFFLGLGLLCLHVMLTYGRRRS